MKIRVVYDTEFYRTIPAVMIDARNGTPLNNAVGSVIKSYTDIEVAKARAANVKTYKLETDLGTLVGYFTLQVASNGASVYQQATRPAFVVSQSAVTQAIINFVISNQWVYD